MSGYVKGINTAKGPMPFFPPGTEIGMVWGVLEDGSWGPVAAGSGGSVAGVLRLIPSATFRVGDNLLPNSPVTLGAGWSGSLADGFTHANGYTEPLTFDIGSADGEAFIIEGGCPNTGSVLLELKIGQSYPTEPYNGTNRICWGVQSVGGGSLVILPKSSFEGTLTDLSCRKVDDNGTDTVTLIRDDIGHTMPGDYLGGMWNVQMGQGALAKMVNATRNVAIGRNALQQLQTGSRNVALGTFTLPKAEYADSNVNIGADSGLAVKTAEHCVAVGRGSMYNGAAPKKNVAIGSHAMNGKKTSGQVADTDVSDSNVAVGYRSAFYSGAEQRQNVVIGADAMLGNGLPADAVQTDNVLIGAKAGYNGSPSKSNNVAIGTEAMMGNGLPENAVQTDNVLIGSKAGYSGCTDQQRNVAIGADAMLGDKLPDNAVQTDNVLIGAKAGYRGCATRKQNVVIGADALSGYDPENSDFDIEHGAAQNFNVAIGFGAGRKCQSYNNVYIGHDAGKGNQTGYQNIYIGAKTGTSSTGYRNTLVGAGAKTNGKLNGCIAIGHSAVATKNNQAVIGGLPTSDDGITETVLMGDLIIVGTDGVKRKIIFNADGTCRWEVV